MSRPEILFPLFAGLEKLDGIGPKTARAMANLAVEYPRDLLFLLPQSCIDRRRIESVMQVTPPAIATIEVTIGRHQPPQRQGGPYRVMVRDRHAEWALVFFHAPANYLQKLLPEGERRLVSGKVESFGGMMQMVHPDHVLRPEEAGRLPDHEPVYPLVAGLTQKGMAKAVASALTRLPVLAEWIDPALKEQKGWPDWKQAVESAHDPGSAADIAPEALPRQRLAYDELFAHQLTLALARQAMRRGRGVVTRGDGRLAGQVLASLPWQPTRAQIRAVAEITDDMMSPFRMNRLLQGDVGAGKTLVALLALLTAVEAGGQGVMMAPTEILARQHYESLLPLLGPVNVRLALLSGRDQGAARADKLGALKDGEIDILIGTHAVFQKDVVYHDLRLAVIDEQHRFGVAQRMELAAKGMAADVLVMTATPIPRSLALAGYGDMDVSVLDEKPAGRKPVQTALVSAGRLSEVFDHLKRAVSQGRQAYWVCPLVDESEMMDLVSAEERFRSLQAILGAERVGLVHGQMLAAEKDAAMKRFVDGETAVLVATTVIEVGVNVPSATIMVIEQAEHFGLAQLHQLRGRVGRGEDQSTCLLLYQPPLGETAMRRLRTIRDTEDGFRIAEEDLAIRGAGDLIGTAQSGLPRFRVADLERQAGLMAMAQSDARNLLRHDPELDSPRGQAARVLLWLLGQDRAIRLINVG